MSAGRPDEVEEGITVYGETLDVIDYLQDCYEKLEAGRESEIISDPFYSPRSGPMSDDLVDKLIREVDAKIDYEINNYPLYHKNRSGANAYTEFHRMGQAARRAMAEGLMRILEEWDDFRKQPEYKAEPKSNGGPSYSGWAGDGGC